MKVSYDKETDSLTITLRDERIKESDEIRPGVMLTLVTTVAWYDSRSCRRRRSSETQEKCSLSSTNKLLLFRQDC